MTQYFILMISDDEMICRKLCYGIIKDNNTQEFEVSFNNSMISYLVFDETQFDEYFDFIETLKPYTEEITL